MPDKALIAKWEKILKDNPNPEFPILNSRQIRYRDSKEMQIQDMDIFYLDSITGAAKIGYQEAS